MNIHQHITKTISKQKTLDRNDKLIIGVSGGQDSLCLLHVLAHHFRDTLELQIHAAHLNHQLRGQASTADAEFVRKISASWNVPVTINNIEVSRIAADRKRGLEDTSRQERYTFLGQVAKQEGATKIVVGHTADDQAETVLMHVLRGSGLTGLRGMAPISKYPIPTIDLPLVRPLLDVPRSTIEAYCQEVGLNPRIDSSNLSLTFLRNRLRHQVLPMLDEISPGISIRLGQLALLTRADVDLLDGLLDDSWDKILRSESEQAISFDLAAWRALPLALRRSSLRRAASQLTGSLKDLTFQHIEGARQVAETGETGSQATLPSRLRLTVAYGPITVSGEDVNGTAHTVWPILGQDLPVALTVPGLTRLPGTGWQVNTRHLSADLETRRTALNNEKPWRAFFLDASQAGPSLILRQRRPGDRFLPLGMGGKRSSVSDFMVNSQIPRSWRGRVPILVPRDRPDQILWIVGWRLDERARVTEETEQILSLSFHRVERNEL